MKKKIWLSVIASMCLILVILTIAALSMGSVRPTAGQNNQNHPSLVANIQKIQKKPIAQIGHAAPEFELQTLEGKTAKLSDAKGKPTLIYFWTSWCGYCKDEMPSIEAAYQQYQDKVNFLTVNITSQDDQADVVQTVNEHPYTFPVLLDKTGEVTNTYQVQGTPTTFLLNKDGMIEKRFVGNMPPGQLNQWLNHQ